MNVIKLAAVLCFFLGNIINTMQNREELVRELQKEVEKLNTITLKYEGENEYEEEKNPKITIFDDNNIKSDILERKKEINRRQINKNNFNSIIEWAKEEGLTFNFKKTDIKTFKPGDALCFTVKTTKKKYNGHLETRNVEIDNFKHTLNMSEEIQKRDGDIVRNITSYNVDKNIYTTTKDIVETLVENIHYDVEKNNIEQQEKKGETNLKLKHLIDLENKRGRGARNREFEKEQNKNN